MKRNIFVRLTAMALLIVMIVPALIACEPLDSDNETTAPVADPTEAPDITGEPDVTTDAATEPEATTEAEATTKAPEETTAAPTNEMKDYVVTPEWKLGYVGSSSNSSWSDKLNPTGSMYSYSDVINLGPAGTTSTFTDDNTNSNGDAKFASASAYVFSSWKKEGGVWVLDIGNYKANGTEADYVDANGARTYKYVSEKDNECIRLCFRSGQSGSFTPAAYPVVTVTSTKQPVVEKDDPNADVQTTAPVEPTGTELNIKWNAGYVGSSTNGYGFANSINPNENNYAYSDVIEIAKKGTKVTFIDRASGSTSGNAYVVSFWKLEGGNWVIDTTKHNIPGGGQYVIKSVSGGMEYTYISSEDNECIRFCFRSNGLNNRPKIYSSEANEPGTLQDIIDAAAAAEKWFDDDKARAYYDILKGKTFTVIGDSYLAGNGLDKNLVWPALLAKKYDMEFNNYGMNGSTMSNYVTTNNPMVVRYTNMVNNNPDIVIIEGGRNDYNKNVPIGENGSTDTKTMKGAARFLISKVQEKYPNALIICLTVWEVGGGKNSAGNYCSDYGRALLEVCADMGVPCINAMDQEATGVKMTDANFRNKYCMKATDISHLNEAGMKLVFPAFEKAIVDFYTAKIGQ